MAFNVKDPEERPLVDLIDSRTTEASISYRRCTKLVHSPTINAWERSEEKSSSDHPEAVSFDLGRLEQSAIHYTREGEVLEVVVHGGRKRQPKSKRSYLGGIEKKGNNTSTGNTLESNSSDSIVSGDLFLLRVMGEKLNGSEVCKNSSIQTFISCTPLYRTPAPCPSSDSSLGSSIGISSSNQHRPNQRGFLGLNPTTTTKHGDSNTTLTGPKLFDHVLFRRGPLILLHGGRDDSGTIHHALHAFHVERKCWIPTISERFGGVDPPRLCGHAVHALNSNDSCFVFVGVEFMANSRKRTRRPDNSQDSTSSGLSVFLLDLLEGRWGRLETSTSSSGGPGERYHFSMTTAGASSRMLQGDHQANGQVSVKREVLYVAGGERNGKSLLDIWQLNLGTGLWREIVFPVHAVPQLPLTVRSAWKSSDNQTISPYTLFLVSSLSQVCSKENHDFDSEYQTSHLNSSGSPEVLHMVLLPRATSPYWKLVRAHDKKEALGSILMVDLKVRPDFSQGQNAVEKPQYRQLSVKTLYYDKPSHPVSVLPSETFPEETAEVVAVRRLPHLLLPHQTLPSFLWLHSVAEVELLSAFFPSGAVFYLPTERQCAGETFLGNKALEGGLDDAR